MPYILSTYLATHITFMKKTSIFKPIEIVLNHVTRGEICYLRTKQKNVNILGRNSKLGDRMWPQKRPGGGSQQSQMYTPHHSNKRERKKNQFEKGDNSLKNVCGISFLISMILNFCSELSFSLKKVPPVIKGVLWDQIQQVGDNYCESERQNVNIILVFPQYTHFLFTKSQPTATSFISSANVLQRGKRSLKYNHSEPPWLPPGAD